MFKKIFFSVFIIILFSLFGFKSFYNEQLKVDEVDVNELSVELILENLKGEKYLHKIDKLDLDKAEIGRQIIFNGKAKNGKKISSYFVCTDCHNTVKENELANDNSPENRLEYAKKNSIPFLPGSTFWGIYNRTKFYNDDYIKKYQDIIKDAKNSLPEAIKVCGKYCSSGRELEEWEIEAILHYFKKNELKIKDIELEKKEYKNVLYWQKLDSDERKILIDKIEKSFITAFPATFLPTMPRENRKYGVGADPVKGEIIFEKSCLYCHENKRVTFLSLSKDKLTSKMFVKHFKDYSDMNIYQIIRWGTYSKAGRKQYMPHYTKEKMSDSQIEDLIAYIKILANKK